MLLVNYDKEEPPIAGALNFKSEQPLQIGVVSGYLTICLSPMHISMHYSKTVADTEWGQGDMPP